jgi:transposase InsO family protein
MSLGYRVKHPKSYRRATQAGSREFPNLLVAKTVTGLNQVWQADMAYYLYGKRPFYTIYITDVYNQEVVGYGAYSSNFSENYVEVLEAAVRRRKRLTGGLTQLIHHSDGGKQYESGIYKKACAGHGIEQSMCLYSYENPYAEKTNDLINNGYLKMWRPGNLEELRRLQHLAVEDHNSNSRKKVLGKKSPIEFREWYLKKENKFDSYRLRIQPPAAKELIKYVNQRLEENCQPKSGILICSI